jgi:hypothetical protein
MVRKIEESIVRHYSSLLDTTVHICPVSLSVGGPVTHLYECLTENKWAVHGVAKYCCYSVYQQKEGEETWTPLVVNQQLGEEEPAEDTINQTATSSTTFTWA